MTRPPRRMLQVHPLGAVAIVVVGTILAGCDTPRDATPRVRQHAGEYPVAVWYYVKGYVPEDAVQAREAMNGDFAHIRSLGFNTIVADGIEDGRRAALLDVADAQSLQVVLPHKRTMAYVRNGRFDPGVMGDPQSVVQQNVLLVGDHPALYMHYVYDAPSLDVAGRLAEMVRIYGRLDPAHSVFVALSRDPVMLSRRANLPVVLWDNFPIAEGASPGELLNRRYEAPVTHAAALAEIRAQTPGRKHWAMIQALAIPQRLRMPTPAEWDLIYLTALAAGFVDGVVFYRYHIDQDPDSGLADANHAMPPERTAAVRRMTKRAGTWGPMLVGAKPAKDVVRTESGRLRGVFLIGPKRQFLLVFNPDVGTFGYDTVHVPATVQGRQVVRAVNVGEPKRYLPVGGSAEIPIELRLRPAESDLFELFGP